MSLTINAKTFTLDSTESNAVKYVGPLKSMSILDDLRLGRTAPKPTSLLSGVSRSSSKLSRTLTLTGALTPTGVAIADVVTSIPVGASDADIDTICADLASFIGSASYKLLLKKQTINF